MAYDLNLFKQAGVAGAVVLLISLVVAGLRGVQPSGDGLAFEQLAVNLLAHKTYTWGDGTTWEKKSHIPKQRRELEPCSDYAPLHPAVLAAAVWIGRGSYGVVGVANAVWLAAAAAFTVLIAAQVSEDRRVPLIAGVLFAGTIPLYANLTTFYREPLYIFLLTAMAWALLRAHHDYAAKKSALLAGVLWGLSILCKPIMLVFVPFYAAWAVLFAPTESRAASLRRAALVLIAAGVVITPWVLRNIYHGIGPVIASQGGQNFMCNTGSTGNNSTKLYPDTEGTFYLLTDAERSTLSESEISSLLYRRRFDRLAANPMLAVRIVARNAMMLLYFIDSTSGRVHLTYVMAFPFFVLGAVAGLKRSGDGLRQNRMLLLCVIAAFSFGLLIHVASPGYRLPVEPLFFSIAAFGLVRVDEQLSARRIARRLLWTGWPVLCLLFFVLYTPAVRSTAARCVNALFN